MNIETYVPTMKKYGKYILALVSLSVLLFCEWFFFRNVIGTGEGALISDRADGRLTMLLTEHWWNFFTGKEKFSEIAMFYPVDEAIGYTDLFLGYGLIHSLFRLTGVNMFVAYKWTVIVVHCFGTITMYYLLKRTLKCNTLWSLFGTMAFSFSDSYARHLGHTQLAAISALPLLLILFIECIKNFEDTKKRNIYAYIFIAWFVLITYNSWYVACFTGVFCLIFIIVYNISLRIEEPKKFCGLWKKIKGIWKSLIGYALFMVVLFIPFIKIYIPVLSSSSGYSYSECTAFLPEFIDLINVTEGNFLLGWFVQKLGLSSRGFSEEVTQGFSIVLLLFFFMGMLIYYKKKRKGQKNTLKQSSDVLIKGVFITIIICLILPIKLSSNGVSLWMIMYALLPVVRSMRAVARFWLWISFPMAVLTAYLSNKYFHLKQRKNIIISTCAVTALFVSNINKVGASSYWYYPEEMKFISNVAAPPVDAEVFYIIDTAESEDPTYIYQLDAFEIAEWYSLKTINGYSGQMPDEWEDIWNVGASTYEGAVSGWVKKNSLENVYAYDRGTNTWICFEDRMKDVIQNVFYPLDNKFSCAEGLEDDKQGEFVWVSNDFRVKICNPEIRNTGLVIKIESFRGNYMQQTPELKPYIRLYVDDEYIQDLDVVDGTVELNVPMQNHESDLYDIRLETNCYFVPNDIRINGDSRKLSLAVYYVGN